MSIRKEVNVVTSKHTLSVRAEFYNCVEELIKDCETLPVRHSEYKLKGKFDPKWEGVSTYEEAMSLLRNGYNPVVEALKAELKATNAHGPRFAFENNIHGFAPIVPLAIKGVPTCMNNMTIEPLKVKVLDVCYDMGINGGYTTEQVLKAGKTVLGAILELEQKGYRVNLTAVQRHYSESVKALDFMCVKIKASNTPLDIKRMSYPLIHPSFFRVVGFDWQGKSPITRYLGSGRGHTFVTHYTSNEVKEIARAIFGKYATYISAEAVIDSDYDKNMLKETFTDVAPTK